MSNICSKELNVASHAQAPQHAALQFFTDGQKLFLTISFLILKMKRESPYNQYLYSYKIFIQFELYQTCVGKQLYMSTVKTEKSNPNNTSSGKSYMGVNKY